MVLRSSETEDRFRFNSHVSYTENETTHLKDIEYIIKTLRIAHICLVRLTNNNRHRVCCVRQIGNVNAEISAICDSSAIAFFMYKNTKLSIIIIVAIN